MSVITFSNTALPIICGCDLLAASEPFYHADRTVEFNILIYVVEGAIYVTEDDTDYEINSGELLFLKSGVHHFGKKEIPRGTKWFYCHFITGSVNSEPFSPDNEYNFRYDTLSSSLTLPKKLTGLSESVIEREIFAFQDYCRSDDRLRGWHLNQRLFSLLSEVAFCNEAAETQPSLSDRIALFLAENKCRPFSADEVSGHFFLSYKHLAAVFKKERSETMQQYHTRIRIAEACRLLRSTLMSVGEIALSLGYTDALYFSRCFRTEKGVSPTAYRKKAPLY